jgi:short subunit dehydrogenase-like uncharacterized protein
MMPDVLVFGATGYTGKLVSEALAERGADFIVAGRNPAKLEALAARTGASEVAVAEVGDVLSLARAAANARVLLSCVGPFSSLGYTAVEAALTAKVNYLDCTGEGAFIKTLVERYDSSARAAGIAVAPAMGFDEVPADVAAALATDGFEDANLVLTYAVSTQASAGTVRSAFEVLTSDARWIEEGDAIQIRTGQEQRWAPMPPPLGPLRGVSFPAAEGELAPLHLDLRGLQLFMAAGSLQRGVLKMGRSALGAASAIPGGRTLIGKALARLPEGPSEIDRLQGTWSILAEAAAGPKRRTVVLSGHDLYGLTAQLLATAALEMASLEYDVRGVVAPVQAIPLVKWEQELTRAEVSIDVFEP